MNNDNKIRVMKGIKVIALVIYGILTIATCAGVWNFCPEKAVKVFAGLLLCANALVIYVIAKKVPVEKKEEEKKDEEI